MKKRIGLALAIASLSLVPLPATAVSPAPVCVAAHAAVDCVFSCIAGTRLVVVAVKIDVTYGWAGGEAHCGGASTWCSTNNTGCTSSPSAPVSSTSLTGRCSADPYVVATCFSVPDVVPGTDIPPIVDHGGS